MLATISKVCIVSPEWLIGLSDLRSPRPVTFALYRTDNPEDDLPEEALKQLNDYIELLRLKYKKKPK
jgi:hypothetical protein